ncbi:MAG TPA: OmpA family protein [Rhodobacteraceae bacterium]|jgi:outer membrane protein OmpA-like peptidoglycan-associated protein|nr:OmpA family protein [Paracoccaceae bacterium]HBG98707.1 OmpA family protein [Paracoccaceae bacterium]
MKALAVLILLAGPAAALTLPEGAEESARSAEPSGRWTLPAGPWQAGNLPVIAVSGARDRAAWRVPGDPDTAGLMAQLRRAAMAAGWQPVWSCTDTACGGFDFRFALDLLGEPAMHVNLGDFRFLAARRDGPGGADHLTILVSQGGGLGYVHMTELRPAGGQAAAAEPPQTDALTAPATPELAAALAGRGRAVLPGIRFATGSAALEPGAEATLAELARWLTDHPGARIALVGHTDFDGALAGNIALSRRRAAAVRDTLIARHNVDPARLEAEGVGYLMPLAANTDAAGRAANRRVEAVVVSPPE